MRKLHILIFGLGILLAGYLLYFSELWGILKEAVPLSVYFEYMSDKISIFTDPDALLVLNQCNVENGTWIFGMKKTHLFSDVSERYFNLNGEVVCENFYVIDSCKESCPYDKCLNKENDRCETIAGNRFGT